MVRLPACLAQTHPSRQGRLTMQAPVLSCKRARLGWWRRGVGGGGGGRCAARQDGLTDGRFLSVMQRECDWLVVEHDEDECVTAEVVLFVFPVASRFLNEPILGLIGDVCLLPFLFVCLLCFLLPFIVFVLQENFYTALLCFVASLFICCGVLFLSAIVCWSSFLAYLSSPSGGIVD